MWAPRSIKEDLTFKNLLAVEHFIYRTKCLLGWGRREAGESIPWPYAAKAVKAECVALTWWHVPSVMQGRRVSARFCTNDVARSGEGLDADVAATHSMSYPSGSHDLCCICEQIVGLEV